MDRLQKHPVNLQAVEDIVAIYSYGDVITISELHSLLNIEFPKTATPEEFQSLSFKFLGLFKLVEASLLEDHQMMLINERGIGYRVCEPSKQTSVAMRVFVKAMKREYKRTFSRMVNINHSMLTSDQANHNADMVAKLAQVRTVTNAQLKGFRLGSSAES